MSALLEIRNASAGHDADPVLRGLNLTVEAGELVCLVGPNGAGKSTLLKLAAGIIDAREGSVALSGRDVTGLSAIERARAMAWLAQERSSAWSLRGVDIAALGRFAREGLAYDQLPSPARECVDEAIDRCGASAFARRPLDRLSGGEKARLHLARILAAEAPLLLLDEPLNALDPRHQLDVMEVLRTETAKGCGVVLALHDLAMARRHADRVVVLDSGCVMADGPPETALSPDILASVFAVKRAADGGFSPI